MNQALKSLQGGRHLKLLSVPLGSQKKKLKTCRQELCISNLLRNIKLWNECCLCSSVYFRNVAKDFRMFTDLQLLYF